MLPSFLPCFLPFLPSFFTHFLYPTACKCHFKCHCMKTSICPPFFNKTQLLLVRQNVDNAFNKLQNLLLGNYFKNELARNLHYFFVVIFLSIYLFFAFSHIFGPLAFSEKKQNILHTSLAPLQLPYLIVKRNWYRSRGGNYVIIVLPPLWRRVYYKSKFLPFRVVCFSEGSCCINVSTQQTHSVLPTSLQRRYNVVTLQRRCCDACFLGRGHKSCLPF